MTWLYIADSEYAALVESREQMGQARAIYDEHVAVVSLDCSCTACRIAAVFGWDAP